MATDEAGNSGQDALRAAADLSGADPNSPTKNPLDQSITIRLYANQ
jgi:hypothetical protein